MPSKIIAPDNVELRHELEVEPILKEGETYDEVVLLFLREKNVMSLKKVKIQTEKTAFWRYQRISETNLSTIEALYFFFRDYETNLNCGGDYSKYSGKYDDILYYYAYNYWLIQKAYTEGNKKDLCFARIKGYIQGGLKVQPETDQKE